VPFALASFRRRAAELGYPDGTKLIDGRHPTSDNDNPIVDCVVGPIDDPTRLHVALRGIPGVVDTGLFLGLASVVLVGDDKTFELRAEKRRP
jgi:ribose 5-phosphate isomerase A